MKDREKAELEISLVIKKESFDRDLTKVNEELKKSLKLILKNIKSKKELKTFSNGLVRIVLSSLNLAFMMQKYLLLIKA